MDLNLNLFSGYFFFFLLKSTLRRCLLLLGVLRGRDAILLVFLLLLIVDVTIIIIYMKSLDLDLELIVIIIEEVGVGTDDGKAFEVPLFAGTAGLGPVQRHDGDLAALVGEVLVLVVLAVARHGVGAALVEGCRGLQTAAKGAGEGVDGEGRGLAVGDDGVGVVVRAGHDGGELLELGEAEPPVAGVVGRPTAEAGDLAGLVGLDVEVLEGVLVGHALDGGLPGRYGRGEGSRPREEGVVIGMRVRPVPVEADGRGEEGGLHCLSSGRLGHEDIRRVVVLSCCRWAGYRFRRSSRCLALIGQRGGGR